MNLDCNGFACTMAYIGISLVGIILFFFGWAFISHVIEWGRRND